jgi:anti-anti-sigma factor
MTDTSTVFEDIQDVIVVRIQNPEIKFGVGQILHDRLPTFQAERDSLKIVMDLSNITFLGSTGLTVLVVFLKRVKTIGGQLVIAGLTGQCRNVMSVTRLDKAFDLYEDIDKAVAALQAN